KTLLKRIYGPRGTGMFVEKLFTITIKQLLNKRYKEMLRNSHKQEIVYGGYEQEMMVPNLMTLSNFRGGASGFTIQEGFDLSTRIIKRAFDICFSLAVLVLGLPIFLTLMVITKLTSKGPVFYKQQRIGINEKP